MKEYSVRAKYTYEGTVTVNAKDKATAIEAVEKHCGHISRMGFHTVLNKQTIPNWIFPTRGTLKIISIGETKF